MQYVVAGLGNPGEEYANTRHNVGRMVVEQLASILGASDWREDKTARALIAKATTPAGDTALCILPDNYMNRSGGSIAPFIKNAAQAERLIVVHDDIDLPVGSIRIVFDRGSGGHRGVESIVRTLKTNGFIRVRVGVVPMTPTGKSRKPKGESGINTLILAPISKKDQEVIARSVTRASDAVYACVTAGREAAMRLFNGAEQPNKNKRTVRPVTSLK
jgi:PTH1 family peptidyl-tRNA hydrolase